MNNNLNVNVNVVLWFYLGRYDFFTLDDISEYKGIIDQLIAESEGLV